MHAKIYLPWKWWPQISAKWNGNQVHCHPSRIMPIFWITTIIFAGRILKTRSRSKHLRNWSMGQIFRFHASISILPHPRKRHTSFGSLVFASCLEVWCLVVSTCPHWVSLHFVTHLKRMSHVHVIIPILEKVSFAMIKLRASVVYLIFPVQQVVYGCSCIDYDWKMNKESTVHSRVLNCLTKLRMLYALVILKAHLLAQFYRYSLVRFLTLLH